MYALKNMPNLNELPDILDAEVFKKMFDLAKIAKLTAEQQTDYYKSLHDMNIMKIQFGKMESTITEQGKTITVLTQEIAERDAKLAEKNAKIAAQAAKLAEYERKYGTLSGTTARSSKVSARNV